MGKDLASFWISRPRCRVVEQVVLGSPGVAEAMCLAVGSALGWRESVPEASLRAVPWEPPCLLGTDLDVFSTGRTRWPEAPSVEFPLQTVFGVR